VDQRKRQKEAIKILIKRTKLSEKVSQISPLSADSPPELSRSAPTSDCTSEHSHVGASGSRRRSLSVESGYSLEYEFEDGTHGIPTDAHGQNIHVYHAHSQLQHPYPFGAFDVDVMTEKQTFVNSFPVRKNSSAFTTTAFRRNSYAGGLGVAPGDTTFTQHQFDMSSVVGSPEEGIENFQFLDFAFGQPTPSSVSTTSDLLSSVGSLQFMPVEDSDRNLLDHFLESVVRLIFPILDLNLHGMAKQEVVLPALTTNKCYMHCCLSIAALHMKSSQQIPSEYIDQDIMRHRYATIAELCEALKQDTDHLQILEATLGMILFQCSVGHPDDSLPDIPWHSHFQAATSLVQKLNLTAALDEITAPGGIPVQYSSAPFNMTLTAWIDILGATMLGRAPQFADTYREKHLSRGHSGLQELMGCDDQVMYLISEIACLEALKTDNMLSDMDLCEHVKSLASKIDETEDMMIAASGLVIPPVVRPDGSIDQYALSRQITAAFRYAARIYLCSLVPGFDRNQIQVKELLNKLVATLEQIPAGFDGFDRSLVLVY